MKNQIKKAIQEAIAKLYPEHKDADFAVDYAPESTGADFASNVAMVLAKKVGKKPMEVADEIAKNLTRPSGTLSSTGEGYKVEAIVPGFLNFSIKPAALIETLGEIASRPDDFGKTDIGRGKLAIVEYFQLNVAKPAHVGHLRSASIGDSLKRVFRFLGYKSVSDTHIGDWGTQFGILLFAYKTLDGRSRVKNSPLEELNELYVEMNKKIETDPALREQAKQEFVKLEQGDPENRELWEFFVSESKKEFDELVRLLKLEKFDYSLGESFYEAQMKEIVSRLEKAKLLVTGEKGEKYIDLEKYNLGRLICIKSDGATTYEMRDLATLAYRYDELVKKEKAELAYNLYVVDARQAHDFRQIFKTMEMLEYDVKKSRHIEFGFMSLPEGAISTRKGNTVPLRKVIEEAKTRALETITEKNPDLPHKEKIAEQVGLAAVKYGDLHHNRKSDITFRWEEALSFEGDTGPYLQYTHARLRSILRKAHLGGKLSVKSLAGTSIGEGERKIISKLSIFPDKIIDTAAEFLPSTLASYLYDLAGAANSFYHSSPVIQEKDEKLRELRLAIVMASANVLKAGLSLLGIEAPEEM